MTTCAPQTLLKRRCWISCTVPTTQPPTWEIGTAKTWNARVPGARITRDSARGSMDALEKCDEPRHQLLNYPITKLLNLPILYNLKLPWSPPPRPPRSP